MVFIVSPFNGKEHYRLDYEYSERRADGSKRWPEPIAVIEIPDYVAALGLDNLIYIWKYGLDAFTFKKDAIANNSVRLCFNIAKLKLTQLQTKRITHVDQGNIDQERLWGQGKNPRNGDE